MFLRAKKCCREGKGHRYWPIVENQRRLNGRVCLRQVRYFDEINDSPKIVWCKAIDVVDGRHDQPIQFVLSGMIEKHRN